MAMADLALFKDKGPISLTDISLRQNISLAYLEQIFIKLKNNNLVRSVRGASVVRGVGRIALVVFYGARILGYRLRYLLRYLL